MIGGELSIKYVNSLPLLQHQFVECKPALIEKSFKITYKFQKTSTAEVFEELLAKYVFSISC